MEEMYENNIDVNVVPNEVISNIFALFVKFVRIFRSINQIHESNLTIISYLIGISKDFFFYLLQSKKSN